MESLVIHAASRESAEGFCSALSGFGAMLVEEANGRCQVEIALGGSDKETLEALDALEAYVCARGDGPARLDLVAIATHCIPRTRRSEPRTAIRVTGRSRVGHARRSRRRRISTASRSPAHRLASATSASCDSRPSHGPGALGWRVGGGAEAPDWRYAEPSAGWRKFRRGPATLSRLAAFDSAAHQRFPHFGCSSADGRVEHRLRSGMATYRLLGDRAFDRGRASVARSHRRLASASGLWPLRPLAPPTQSSILSAQGTTTCRR